MNWIPILSFLILGLLVNQSQAEESTIVDALTEDENEKNVLDVLTRKLSDEENRDDEFCRSILDSDPAVSITISF